MPKKKTDKKPVSPLAQLMFALWGDEIRAAFIKMGEKKKTAQKLKALPPRPAKT